MELVAALREVERERDEMRRTILGGEPDPRLKHSNFMEMIATTEAALRAVRNRATRAEAALAQTSRVALPTAGVGVKEWRYEWKNENAPNGRESWFSPPVPTTRQEAIEQLHAEAARWVAGTEFRLIEIVATTTVDYPIVAPGRSALTPIEGV